jgi:hypothetical protein
VVLLPTPPLPEATAIMFLTDSTTNLPYKFLTSAF